MSNLSLSTCPMKLGEHSNIALISFITDEKMAKKYRYIAATAHANNLAIIHL